MTQFTTDVVIGLEIHVELATNSKLFCGCPTHGDDAPNSRTCEICLGHPGSKPVLNKKAVEFAMKLALALNCKISSDLVFSRKSYFYPDMAKNYQISQYEIPLGTNGVMKIKGKEVGITRVHMEEDPAALTHPSGMQNSSFVLVDYNRSGDALCEVVTEPDMTSPDEARDFMKQLISILNYLEIFDVDRCIIKADANISIKETGYIRAEIKNVTGFKEIERALKYELARQKENPSEVVQETRAWDAEKGITFSLRKKEVEAEYGYIIDPDLVKIELGKEWVSKIKADMPELAEEKLQKYEEKHGKVQSISVITKNPKLAKFFEDTINEGADEKQAAFWVELELQRVLNYNKQKIDDTKITPKHIADIIKLIHGKKITESIGKKILENIKTSTFDVNDYVKKEKLEVVQGVSEIKDICKKVISDNAQAVEQYKSGEKKAIQFLIGQVMRATKGTASPKVVNEVISKLLD